MIGQGIWIGLAKIRVFKMIATAVFRKYHYSALEKRIYVAFYIASFSLGATLKGMYCSQKLSFMKLLISQQFSDSIPSFFIHKTLCLE